MTDKDSSSNQNNKLPYIVLPSLSSKETTNNKGAGKRNESNGKAGLSRSNTKAAARSNVKQPVENSKLPLLSPPNGTTKRLPARAASPKEITSSKALNRHIAISKQLNGNHGRDIQDNQRRVLIARCEVEQSPTGRSVSVYGNGDACSSCASKGKDDSLREEAYAASVELAQLLNDQKDSQGARRKLETLVQLFPPRVRKPKTTRVSKQESPCGSNFQRNDSSDEDLNMMAAKLAEFTSSNKQGNRNNHQKAETKSEDSMSATQIQSKFDSIAVHIHNRDTEMSQLSQDLIDLQLLVLKEKKESEKSKNTISKLENEVRRLQGNLLVVEKIVEGQERKILEKLFMFDEIESTDSDSDFGTSANWTVPTRQTSAPVKHTPSSCTNSYALGTLKECTNWIPVAPDFDKLINIISLMNIRMDRNQSTKLTRKGNTASFQHSETTNLTLYKNGLILGTSLFRSYTSLSVIKLINEIFQGYFPSELQPQYPEGVVFVIIDKRSLIYDHGESSFFGEGNKLIDSNCIPKIVPGQDNKSVANDQALSKESDTDISTSAVSVQSFPPSPSPSETILKCLPTLESESQNSDLILLKLKNSENGKTYKLQVSNSCSINDLTDHLMRHVKDPKYEDLLEEGSTTPVSKYEIVQPVPYGILTSGTSTLKDYGIIQNTLLYFKRLP